MFVLWDTNGNRVEGDCPPEEYANLLDSDASSLDFDRDGIVASVSVISGLDVQCIHQIASNHYRVLDIIVSTGKHFIVRISNQETEAALLFARDKLRRECEMMEWMSSVTDIPIPKVYLCDLQAKRPYMISDKCKGDTIIDRFGILPDEAKLRNIASFADISIQMFHANAPHGQIGSVDIYSSGKSGSDGPILGPWLDPNGGSPDAPFTSINEYLSWLVKRKLKIIRGRQSSVDLENVHQTLKDIETYVLEVVGHLDSSLLRPVPVHEDLVAHNVFCDKAGAITGVIDWEFHSLKPAILAAEYPSWICYEKSYADPQETEKESQFSVFHMASPPEAEMLRGYYDSIVSEKDPEYFRALKDPRGHICRTIERLLLEGLTDLGCKQLQGWFKSMNNSYSTAI